MAITDIILPKGKILIKRTNASLIGVASGTNQWYFGDIEKVYSTCDKFEAGQTVFFKGLGEPSLLEGTYEYYLVDDDNISNSEVAPP
jgi:hypothetical protein